MSEATRSIAVAEYYVYIVRERKKKKKKERGREGGRYSIIKERIEKKSRWEFEPLDEEEEEKSLLFLSPFPTNRC